jgi:hypothetical protein
VLRGERTFSVTRSKTSNGSASRLIVIRGRHCEQQDVSINDCLPVASCAPSCNPRDTSTTGRFAPFEHLVLTQVWQARISDAGVRLRLVGAARAALPAVIPELQHHDEAPPTRRRQLGHQAATWSMPAHVRREEHAMPHSGKTGHRPMLDVDFVDSYACLAILVLVDSCGYGLCPGLRRARTARTRHLPRTVQPC